MLGLMTRHHYHREFNYSKINYRNNVDTTGPDQKLWKAHYEFVKINLLYGRMR